MASSLSEAGEVSLEAKNAIRSVGRGVMAKTEGMYQVNFRFYLETHLRTFCVPNKL